MTITQQIEYIMGHPYMSAARSDDAVMRKLLFEVHFHVYSVCAMNGAKAFRRWRDMTDPVIYEAIRDMEPPLELDIRLPFAKVVEVACAVVPLRVVHAPTLSSPVTKTRVRLSPNPFQIEIEFPLAVLVADLMEG